jgi:hypothetical protein
MNETTCVKAGHLLLAAGVAVLAVFAGACAGPASGSGDSTAVSDGAGGTGGAGGTDADSGGGQDAGSGQVANIAACELLTEDDVLQSTKDLKAIVTVVDSQDDTPTEPDPVYGQVSQCGYQLKGVAGGTTMEGGFMATLVVKEKGAPIDFTPSSDAESVDGIGDGAYWSAPSELSVRVGETAFTVSAKVPVSASDYPDLSVPNQETTEALARTVVDRL